MYRVINSSEEIGSIITGLSRDSLINLAQSGPILGILKLSCTFSRGAYAPVPAVVGAKLLEVQSFTWADFSGHLDWFLANKNASLKTENAENIDQFRRNLIYFSQNSQKIFGYNVALFIESQMKIFFTSPYRVQDIVMKLTQPVLEDGELFYKYADSIKSNITIYSTIHAGKYPFVQVNFPESTLNNFNDLLEPGIAQIIPQLVNFTIKNIIPPDNYLFKSIFQNEFSEWKKEAPKIGVSKSWDWLPNFYYQDFHQIQTIEKNNLSTPFIEKTNADSESEYQLRFNNQNEENNSIQENNTSNVENEKNNNPDFKKYYVYGFFMIFPIPFINWVWLILGIISAIKDGKSVGFKGIAIQLGIAYAGRFILGLLIAPLLN